MPDDSLHISSLQKLLFLLLLLLLLLHCFNVFFTLCHLLDCTDSLFTVCPASQRELPSLSLLISICKAWHLSAIYLFVVSAAQLLWLCLPAASCRLLICLLRSTVNFVLSLIHLFASALIGFALPDWLEWHSSRKIVCRNSAWRLFYCIYCILTYYLIIQRIPYKWEIGMVMVQLRYVGRLEVWQTP